MEANGNILADFVRNSPFGHRWLSQLPHIRAMLSLNYTVKRAIQFFFVIFLFFVTLLTREYHPHEQCCALNWNSPTARSILHTTKKKFNVLETEQLTLTRLNPCKLWRCCYKNKLTPLQQILKPIGNSVIISLLIFTKTFWTSGHK